MTDTTKAEPAEQRNWNAEKPASKGGDDGVHLPASVAAVIAGWPTEPKEAARRLIKYYGVPDEYSQSQLIWYSTKDGWKRSVLSREETPHEFPAPHTDYLEQFIDYQVPVEMFSKLAEYDGSVVANRTMGELSARCGGTSMNFVAINLAHDVVSGRRDVAEARAEYARLYAAYKRGEKPPYAQEFQFSVATGGTGDPDTQTLPA
jgi:hypothetical protein